MKVLAERRIDQNPFELFRNGVLNCPSCRSELQIEDSDAKFVMQDAREHLLRTRCPVCAHDLYLSHHNLIRR